MRRSQCAHRIRRRHKLGRHPLCQPVTVAKYNLSLHSPNKRSALIGVDALKTWTRGSPDVYRVALYGSRVIGKLRMADLRAGNPRGSEARLRKSGCAWAAQPDLGRPWRNAEEQSTRIYREECHARSCLQCHLISRAEYFFSASWNAIIVIGLSASTALDSLPPNRRCRLEPRKRTVPQRSSFSW